MKKILLIPVLFLLACNNSAKEEKQVDNASISYTADMNAPREDSYAAKESSVSYTEPRVEDEYETKPEMQTQQKVAKMIIKDGDMRIRSEKLESSKHRLDHHVKVLGAYYESEELISNENEHCYQLKIRIPSENFEKLLSAIESGKDKLEHKSIQATDVTEEYTDTKLRIASKRAYLERYKELVSKAKSVKELLEIEEIIRTLQEEIESREGRLRFLQDQSAYSTLSIKLYHELEITEEKPHEATSWEKMGDSLAAGWFALVAFFLWILKIWPLVIILGVGGYVLKRWLNNKNKKVA